MRPLVDWVWLYCCYQCIMRKYSDLCRTWWILSYKGHVDISVDGSKWLNIVTCYTKSCGILTPSVTLVRKGLSEEGLLTWPHSMKKLALWYQEQKHSSLRNELTWIFGVGMCLRGLEETKVSVAGASEVAWRESTVRMDSGRLCRLK